MSKIMVIDDSNTIRKTADMFLKKSSKNYDVYLVQDGFEALGKIVDIKPDIIFVDIEMPNLGGYHFCQLVKNHKDFEDIPIIILSSKDGVFDKITGDLVGANEYMTKPFSKEVILSMVEKYLG